MKQCIEKIQMQKSHKKGIVKHCYKMNITETLGPPPPPPNPLLDPLILGIVNVLSVGNSTAKIFGKYLLSNK